MRTWTGEGRTLVLKSLPKAGKAPENDLYEGSGNMKLAKSELLCTSVRTIRDTLKIYVTSREVPVTYER